MLPMPQKIIPRTKEDEIYEGLQHLSLQINLMRQLYPRAMREVFSSNNIEVSNVMSFNKKNYKKNELKNLTMAHLTVDSLKKEYANN